MHCNSLLFRFALIETELTYLVTTVLNCVRIFIYYFGLGSVLSFVLCNYYQHFNELKNLAVLALWFLAYYFPV